MPDLTLLFPGALQQGPGPSTLASHLARRLRRARIVHRWRDDGALPRELPHEAWLRRQFAWPQPASIEAASAHLDQVPRPALRLTPVHLHVARDHLVLTDPAQLALDPEEAAQLAASASAIFAEQGLHLQANTPRRWYLTGETLPVLDVHSSPVAVGRNIDAFSPRGADARRWRRLINEIQMTWHIDPLNAARASRGLPAVNGLWLEGLAPEACDGAPFDRIETDDAAIAGLALARGVARIDWRGATDVAIAAAQGSSGLVSHAGGHGLRAYRARRDLPGDEGIHAAHAQDEHAHILAPLTDALKALDAGSVARLTVVLCGERSGMELALTRADRLRLWHRLDPGLLSESDSA